MRNLLFGGSVDFDPSASTAMIDAGIDYDIFLACYTTSGDYQFAGSLGDDQYMSPGDLSVQSDAIYLTGSFSGTVDFNMLGSGSFLTSGGDQDIFVLKMTSAGTFEWAVNFVGVSLEVPKSIAVDNQGGVYVTGSFTEAVDFYPGTGVHFMDGGGSISIFVARLDGDGFFSWAKSIEGTDNVFPADLQIDAYDNLYVAGSYNGTVDTDMNSGVQNLGLDAGANQAVFVAKYDQDGNYVWSRKFCGDQFVESINIAEIQVDTEKSVYITGSFKGSIDFNPGEGVSELVSMGFDNGYLVKVRQSGTLDWAAAFLGEYNIHPKAIAVHSDLYLSGAFFGEVDFDPSDNEQIHTAVPNSTCDLFVLKFDQGVVGMEQLEEEGLVGINPVFDRLMLNSGFVGRVQAFDQSGRLVLSKTGDADESSIDVSALNPGTYVIQFDDGTFVRAEKFVKI